jgi:O-acetyl-ADP-ribose deacetylase (regulator of RNase III)
VIATSGGSLPCKKVIHAVGPIYSKKGFECPLLFKRTIANSLSLANLMKMKSIAFPALCTGLYGFSTSLVSKLLFDEILKFSKNDNKHSLREIRLIDLNENRAKLLAREFENRDFTQDGQRKSVLDELEGLLSNDLRVIVSEPG